MLKIFGPIWILAAVGYLARRRGLLDENASSVLGQFVFHVAMPAALFLTLSTTPLSDFGGQSLIAFGTSTTIVIGTGWLAARYWLRRTAGEQVIWGMSAGYVNSANLGLPIALRLLGSTAFLVQVILLQLLVVTPIILISLDRTGDPEGRIRLRRIASLPSRNPILLASVAGVIASAAGFHLDPSSLPHACLALLADAAVPTALVALGASLCRDAPAADSSYLELSVVTALKLVVQPAIAYAVGAFLLDLSSAQLLAVTVCAGLPTAQNTFIFAQQHGVGEAQASRAVLATTTLSLATLAVIAALLGR